MSRAFVSDKEDWAYCAKAGERCLHADPERDCHKTDCPHYYKSAQPVAKTSGDRTVRRHPGKEAGQSGGNGTGSKPAKDSPAGQRSGTGSRSSAAASGAAAGSARRTKRANLKPPKRWGGRSG
ncbi:MAG: hypothetical protein IJJ21_05640 [Firmicutes bacterium]|nr:hypothetical protein [Bacillota bacterium]